MNNAILKDSINSKRNWGILGVALSAICVLIILQTNPESTGIFTLAGIIGAFFAIISMIYPNVWVYTTILLLPAYLISRDSDVNAMEVVVYVYILFGTILWFMNTFLIKRERLARNVGDFILLLFFVFAAINSIIAYLNDVQMFNWFKQYSLFGLYTLYFPFRYYVKEKKDLNLFLILLGFSLLVIGAYQLYYYKQVVLLATLAYELQGALRINITILTFGSLLGIYLFLKFKNLALRIFSLLVAIVSTIVIITSFARTFWILLLFLYGCYFFLLKKRHKIIALYIGSVSVVAMLFLLVTYFGNYTVYMKMISEKFMSTGDGKADPSVMQRIIEYDAVWNAYSKYPISGCGLAKKFSHRDILIEGTTRTKDFVHNGYLQLLYNFGPPTALLFVLFLAYYLFRSMYFLIPSVRKRFHLDSHTVFLSFCGIFIYIVSAGISPQLVAKESILMLVISILILENELHSDHQPIKELKAE
jgi:O-antigen ligase